MGSVINDILKFDFDYYHLVLVFLLFDFLFMDNG